MGFVALQFNNCGGPQTQNLFDGSSLCPEGNCTYTEDGQSQSLRMLNDSVSMRCEENGVHIGGTCNPGDVYDNEIRYSLARTDSSGTYTMGNPLTTKCESGRFNFILPSPVDPVYLDINNFTDGYVDYQLSVQLYSKASKTASFVAGPRFSTTIKIQYRNTTAAEVSQGLVSPCLPPPHSL